MNWALSHKWITSIIAVLMLLGSLFLVPLIGASYLPSEEEKTMQLTYSPEPGETKKKPKMKLKKQKNPA